MTVLKKATVKSYDAANHKAAVQIAGSLAVWLDNVRVATSVRSGEVIVGRECNVLFVDPSNQDDAVIVSIQGAVPYPRPFPQIRKSGVRWVIPGWLAHNSVGTGIAAGTLYYVPIYVPETFTYIAIGAEVIVAGLGFFSNTMRMGIYNWTDGSPSSLVLDAGTVGIGTTGQKSITISQTLNAGFYFLAYVTDEIGLSLFGPDVSFNVHAPVSAFYVASRPLVRYPCLTATGRGGDVAAGLQDPAPTPITQDQVTKACVLLREQ